MMRERAETIEIGDGWMDERPAPASSRNCKVAGFFYPTPDPFAIFIGQRNKRASPFAPLCERRAWKGLWNIEREGCAPNEIVTAAHASELARGFCFCFVWANTLTRVRSRPGIRCSIAAL